jgi:hypothetical protein
LSFLYLLLEAGDHLRQQHTLWSVTLREKWSHHAGTYSQGPSTHPKDLQGKGGLLPMGRGGVELSAELACPGSAFLGQAVHISPPCAWPPAKFGAAPAQHSAPSPALPLPEEQQRACEESRAGTLGSTDHGEGGPRKTALNSSR